MDLGQVIGLIFIVGIGWLVFRIPDEYLHGYADWIKEKHGVAIKTSFGILLLAVGAGLMLILEKPEKHEAAIEWIVMALALLSIGIVAWDNAKFWREKYRQD